MKSRRMRWRGHVSYTGRIRSILYIGCTERNEHSNITGNFPEYRNQLFRDISGIFPLQHERKIRACSPLTFPSCLARKWLSPTCFVNVLSLNFFWKRGNSAGLIYERLRGVYGDVCMGVSSVRRWVKHFKDGNTDIADQSRCGRQRTAATERNKHKVDELIGQDRRISQGNCSADWGGAPRGPGDNGDFGISESLFPLGSPFSYGYKTKRLETVLISTIQSRFGPLRLLLVWVLRRSPDRSPLRDWRGSPGSRAKLVARSWNGFLPQRHF
jgi:hypothetical protein